MTGEDWPLLYTLYTLFFSFFVLKRTSDSEARKVCVSLVLFLFYFCFSFSFSFALSSRCEKEKKHWCVNVIPVAFAFLLNKRGCEWSSWLKVHPYMRCFMKCTRHGEWADQPRHHSCSAATTATNCARERERETSLYFALRMSTAKKRLCKSAVVTLAQAVEVEEAAWMLNPHPHPHPHPCIAVQPSFSFPSACS